MLTWWSSIWCKLGTTKFAAIKKTRFAQRFRETARVFSVLWPTTEGLPCPDSVAHFCSATHQEEFRREGIANNPFTLGSHFVSSRVVTADQLERQTFDVQPRSQGHPRVVQAELSRAVIGTISSAKHCLWLVCSVGLLPRHAEKSNLHSCHFSLRILSILCGRSARLNVLPTLWMGKQARKMLSGEQQLKASEECAAKRLLGQRNAFQKRKSSKRQNSVEKLTQNSFMRERQAPWKQFTEAAKRPNEFPRASVH